MKDLAMEVVELYDERGYTIMQIVRELELSEDLVLQILNDFSDSFNVV
jgi:hypothetical protein